MLESAWCFEILSLKIYYRMGYLFYSCFTKKPTYLKLNTLIKFLKIITF